MALSGSQQTKLEGEAGETPDKLQINQSIICYI